MIIHPLSCFRRCIHSRSEIVRRTALLRQSKQRRDQAGEILVKGREQIETMMRQDGALRFSEILVSNRLDDYTFLSGYRADRIRKLDPKLLYYISYQSKPLPSSPRREDNTADLSESENQLLSDENITNSLMVATLPKPVEELPANARFLLCLDRVIFPDNVGSLVRSAHAIGSVDGIIGTPGTCDFNGWKVLESSGGYGFGLPKTTVASTDELITLIIKHNLLPIVGHSSLGIDPKAVDTSEHDGVIVIIGNEKHGPAKELLDIAVRVRIPISERVNSLNAGIAGGILLQMANAVNTKRRTPTVISTSLS